MDLTNSRRTLKLLRAHLTQPRWLLPWLRDNVLARRSPIEMARPWFSYAATEWLAGHVRPAMRIFEYGSGGSTLFFSSRVAAVVSVEDDAAWQTLVTARLAELGRTNVELRHRAFDFTQPRDFASSEYVAAVRDGAPWDIILVDGQDWTFHERPVCFAAAQECVASGGVIIVDDSWRYPQLRATARTDRVSIFESTGPGRLGVTSTDAYFY